jgi:glycosyltransferase involved in cell wall biosynthesis
MKINIILGPFLPGLPGPAGAVEKLWQGVGKRLAAAGHEVTLIEKEGVARDAEDSGPGTLRYVQVRGFERPAGIVGALLCDFIYSHRVLAALPSADLTVSNTFFLPTFVLRLQRIMKARQVGILVPNVARMPKGQARFFSGLKAITAVSEATRQALLAEPGTAKLNEIIHVVPNPVDISVFNPVGRPAAGRHARRILYAGRLAEEKGVKILVAAFVALREQNHLQEFELLVVGPHETALGGGGKSYLEACRALGKGHPVRFLPPIREPKLLADEMRQAEFFVYPSLADRGETFGISALEAMACGAMTIVSDLACFKDFIIHGENGFVFDHRSDPQAALEATLLEVAQTDDAKQITRNAVNTAEKFSYAEVSKQYCDLFKFLIESDMKL